MATEVVTGLSGAEIKKDYLAHLSKRLDGDCNLRDMDSYSRGYSGWIEYHIEMYGLDHTIVEGKLTVGVAKDDPEIEVQHGKITIDHETDLDAVRERMEEMSEAKPPEPTVEVESEGGALAQSPQRRTYRKRVTVPLGGSEGIIE